MNSQCQIFSDREVESLRQGGSILRDCLAMLKGLVKPGVSTLALDQAAEEFIRAHGAAPAFKGYFGYPASLCASINNEVVHGIPRVDRILREGDILSLDCGVLFKGLNTDACVSVGVGSITPKTQRFLTDVSEALEAVIVEVVRAGTRVGDISSFIEQRFRKHGYAPVRSLTGHGLGTKLHQFPDVPNIGKKSTGPVLPAGTMIAIEPIAAMGKPAVSTLEDGWTIVTADGSLACHFEHSVLLTEGGVEIIA